MGVGVVQLGTRGGGTNRLPQAIEVLGCEVVPTGGGQDLLRVTLVAQRTVRLAEITLTAEDSAGVHRFGALPALPTAGNAHPSTLTVGFAMASSLTTATLMLEADGARLALPSPAVRLLSAPSRETKQGAVLAAELRTLDFATAAVRAESDRLELEAALMRSQSALNEAEAELAQLRVEAPPAEPDAPRHSVWSIRRVAAAGAAAVICGVGIWALSNTGTDHPAPARAAFERPPVLRTDVLSRRLAIPQSYLDLYRSAGRRWGLDWTMLAAVGDIETEHGRAPLPGVTAGANGLGAAGPAQFLSGTWEDYGLDGDGDGVRNPYDPADAIPSMASYLRASGAPKDWTGALMAYNHSATYAAAVQQRAAHYRALIGR